MKLIIEIPKEFEEEFETNRFSETFWRIEGDIMSYRHDQGGYGLSGNYEDETRAMLKKAFEKAEPVIHAHWEYVDYGGVGNYHCSNCRAISETQYNGLEPIPKLSKYCSECGARMDEVKAND